MSTVNERISAFRAELGARSDRKLAEMLDITVAAISAWRRRGTIPKDIEGKVRALAARTRSARIFAAKMEAFAPETWGKGRCLALFLAPSLDALKTKRFPATIHYGELLDTYAASFEFITMACAEEVEARMSESGGSAADALGVLTQEDERQLYGRIMDRADWWKYADIGNEVNTVDVHPTLHDRRAGFRHQGDDE